MRQTIQKKPKIFRTLIHRIHIDSKIIRKDDKTQTAEKKPKNQPPFFFGW